MQLRQFIGRSYIFWPLLLAPLLGFMGYLCFLWSDCKVYHLPPPGSSLESYQTYYERSWWYFAPDINLPLKIAAYKEEMRRNSDQAFFETPQGRRIIYTEHHRSRMFKSMPGMGLLVAIPEETDPIFIEKWKSRFKPDPDYLILIGFAGNRSFTVEVHGSNKDYDGALEDALTVAHAAYEGLKNIPEPKWERLTMLHDRISRPETSLLIIMILPIYLIYIGVLFSIRFADKSKSID